MWKLLIITKSALNVFWEKVMHIVSEKIGTYSATPTGEAVFNGMRAIHPGEILREEFLEPMGITAHALAMALQVPAPRIHDIVRERRAVSVDTALRLAKYLGTSPEFWLGLQADHDMAVARAAMGDALSRIVSFQYTG
jgi:antitoxin HigA-1